MRKPFYIRFFVSFFLISCFDQNVMANRERNCLQELRHYKNVFTVTSVVSSPAALSLIGIVLPGVFGRLSYRNGKLVQWIETARLTRLHEHELLPAGVADKKVKKREKEFTEYYQKKLQKYPTSTIVMKELVDLLIDIGELEGSSKLCQDFVWNEFDSLSPFFKDGAQSYWERKRNVEKKKTKIEEAAQLRAEEEQFYW